MTLERRRRAIEAWTGTDPMKEEEMIGIEGEVQGEETIEEEMTEEETIEGEMIREEMIGEEMKDQGKY